MIAALVVSLVLGCLSVAQTPADLDRLDEKIKRHFETVLPGWKHKRVEPLGNGPNVLVQFWSFANRYVKVSVLVHKSADDARQVLQNHAKYSFNKVSLSGVGDEAYVTDSRSDVAFRRGRFTVYVSSTADVDADPDARDLTQAQRSDREKSETERTSKELATHVARALDEP